MKNKAKAALESAIRQRASQLAEATFQAYHEALKIAVRNNKCKPDEVDKWQPGLYLMPSAGDDGAPGARWLQWIDPSGTPRRRPLQPTEAVVDGADLVKLDETIRQFQGKFDMRWLAVTSRAEKRKH